MGIQKMRQGMIRDVMDGACFHAIYVGSGTDTYRETPFKFTTELTNYKSCYDSSTGLFTAPFDGNYFFSAGSHNHSTAGYVTIRIHAAGQQYSNAWTRTVGDGTSGNQLVSAVAHMTVGQTAHVSMDTDSSDNYMAETYWYFNGFSINGYVQSQQERIDDLEARILALETSISS